MITTDILRFPFTFDVDRLRADLAALPPDGWVRHFNTAIYSGEWSGVSLRSVGGSTAIYPDPSARDRYEATAILGSLPYISEVLAGFRCNLFSVRLLKLGPGASVREHRDFFQDDEIRVHIPIVSGPGVGFYLDGEQVVMGEGECWYMNFNRPHRVENNGDSDRIHLVVDCEVNDWIRSLFPPEEIEAA